MGGDQTQSLDATLIQNQGRFTKSSGQTGTEMVQTNILSNSAFQKFPDVTMQTDPWANEEAYQDQGGDFTLLKERKTMNVTQGVAEDET